MQNEKVLETIEIDGVEFEIIQKAATSYAGSYYVAPDLKSEPDVHASWQWFQNNKDKIIDSITPDCMICLSINYGDAQRVSPCAMLHGQETSSAKQPEGVHVIEAEPTILIKVKSTEAAWALTKKLTGEDDPRWHMAPLFGLIRHIFCTSGKYSYEFNGCKGKGNEETEYYCFNGDKYVTVPVLKKDMQLPSEFIIQPKDKIAEFSGEKWPFSNVEPAIYAALGLFYGKTENRDASGRLVNSDLEYSIHNVLTGHAFGLFNCLPDISSSMGMYGFSSSHIDIGDVTEDEIMTLIKTNICLGNAVHIDEGNGPFDYLIWGYKDNGDILLGYRFEHGDDMGNCAFDFEKPMEFDSLAKSFSDTAIYKMNGEMPGGITIIRPDGEKQDKMTLYKRALTKGHRMLTQIEPAPAMDFARVHFGYGQAIYDEWARQIEEMQKADCVDFLYVSPIFPHFIALYENRLHLWRFLNHLNTIKTDGQSMNSESLRKEDLQKAVDLCEKLKDLAADAATVTMDGDWNPLRNASNHEKRALLLDSLAKCRALELETAESIRKAIGG